MKRLTLIAVSVLALIANTTQAAEKKCFQLADDDPSLITDCPQLKLAQGESRAFNGGGPQNQNQNNNQNQNQNNNQNQNGNGSGDGT